MKIVTVLGARPQFIKASSLSRAISEHPEFEEVIIHTGQHFDENMSHVFFDEMHIPEPKYNLDINQLSHGAMTGRMLEKIEEILNTEQPEWVIVYGDTNSTIAGALAAKKMGFKVAHVEAGLRSFDMKMPEEINRILTDQISDVLFCPTQVAVNNLKNEGFDEKNVKIVNSGDIMLDSALFYKLLMKKPESIEGATDFILATVHRQENTDSKSRLEGIVNAFNQMVDSGHQIICPLHPRTKGLIAKYNLRTRFQIIEPVGYLEMIYLLEKCKMVITDSGGLQKEAYFFNKFCITLRDSTEWTELIDAGANILMDVNEDLVKNLESLITATLDEKEPLYGNGSTSGIILESLQNFDKQ